MLDFKCVKVPTPYPVGPVNSYLIKNNPLTIIDPGPETSEAIEVWEKTFSCEGLKSKDLKRIVLTHSHTDHSGLAQRLANETGALVYLHRYENLKLKSDYSFISQKLSFLQAAGVPEEIIKTILDDKDVLPPPRLDDEVVRLVDENTVLDFEGGTLKVLHTPGHATGHISLYDNLGKNLFAGDIILKHITPNPILEEDPSSPGKCTKSLAQYLNSIELLSGLEIDTVWTGHGEKVTNAKEVLNRAKSHHVSRLAVLLSVLGENESNVYELCNKIYPGVYGFNMLLGISEIQAHIDLLLDRGQVRARTSERITYYRRWA